MDLPGELFVRAVPDSDDIVAFQFPFALEAKAQDDGSPGALVEVLEDGDLIIEGWAAEFEGQDRTNENFMDGAFQRGIKAFMDGSASLCYHHKTADVLGKVLELQEVEGRGLRMRARVDGAIKDHPTLGPLYAQIKKGTLTGLSVGGYFKRKLTEAGRKISDMDFTEISITGVPTHTKPAFAVVAGKALGEKEGPKLPEVEENGELATLSAALDGLEATFASLGGKAVKGDPQDNYFLALLLELEQMSNNIATKKETESGGPVDDRVDSLVEEVRDALDGFAREAHKLAGKLGPLPKISYA